MKLFVAFALIVAVASASYTKPTLTEQEIELQEIIAAIQSPSTNPATAAALEQMLLDLLGIQPEPIAIGPAIVGPPAPVESNPINPQPIVVAPTTPSAPLVQIILNINAVTGDIGGAIPSPVIRPEPFIVDPVQIVDNWPVVEPIDDAPIEISPDQVVDVAPVPIEPVIIGTPIIPVPAVTLPEQLN